MLNGSSGRNSTDLQFGVLLTMTLALLVVLATAHLEDADLVVLAMRHDRGFYSCAGYQGRSNLDFSAVSDGQNLVDDDLLAYIRSNLFYFDILAGSNAILLATGFYDRVQVDLSSKDAVCALQTTVRTQFRAAGEYSIRE